jgi:aryl-alcohol dehydrogenase-like predicted oxidoreductase
VRYITIPNTNLEVSALCLGTGAYGTQVDEETAFQIMDRFVEIGGTFFDTANVYGRWNPDGQPVSEIIIGRWLEARKCRKKIVLATKCACPNLSTMHIPRLSSQEIEADLEDSLKNLKTDYIDLFWLHHDDPNRPVAEILDTLGRQVEAGKILQFGCCNWSVSRLREAWEYANLKQIRGFVAHQMLWNLASVNVEELNDLKMVAMNEQFFEFFMETGLPVVAYSSQAKGFFSMALHEDFAYNPAEENSRYFFNPTTMERAERVQQLSTKLGVETTQVALSYLFHQPILTIPIVGPSNVRELEDSVGSLDIHLSAEDTSFLLDEQSKSV